MYNITLDRNIKSGVAGMVIKNVSILDLSNP
jgi:hypothetical protein